MSGFRSRVVCAVAVSGLVLAASNAKADPADAIQHIVVIYQENHSFDNLFGGWERVEGIAAAAKSGHMTQNDADGKPLPCLLQIDVNLASPPLEVKCKGSVGTTSVDSAFANKPFLIDSYIHATDKTCPPGDKYFPKGIARDAEGAEEGGCTADLDHKFYEEQYQIHGGRQDRYAIGSNAVGLVMGRYDTKALPIYKYLHGPCAPRYVIADHFFQGAFGGSFLNHQWLIAAATPKYPDAPADVRSILGADGSGAKYPLHPTTGLVENSVTQAANADGTCQVAPGNPTPPANTVCGDYAVNTIQPFYEPHRNSGARLPAITSPTKEPLNIGDELTDAKIDWAWYSGGWDNAAGNKTGIGWTSAAVRAVWR